MTSEQMIEEAARAMFDCTAENWFLGPNAEWDEADEVQRDRWRVRARAALTVFEGAYTPTDDEREALADLLDDLHDPCVTEGGCEFTGWDRGWRPGDPATVSSAVDRILAAGFHRTVQGEPSDDYEAGYAEGFHHGRSTPREAQGEPGLRAHVRNLMGATDAELDDLGGFQGEPSDAQADAAAQAITDHDHYRMTCYDHDGICCPCGELHDASRREWRRHRARAALRAAAETGGEHRG